MSARVEWCDSTINPWGAGSSRRLMAKANWKLPERWNDTDPFRFMQCPLCGWRGELTAFECPGDCANYSGFTAARRRVFSASLGDWLDNEVPIEWLVAFLGLVRRTPNLDWLLLTKQIGNWRSRLTAASTYAHLWCLHDSYRWIDEWLEHGNAPANVWIGATVVNQAEADRDVPRLLAVPAAIHFLSIEPMLGPIKLDYLWMRPEHSAWYKDGRIDGNHQLAGVSKGLDWIIAGGESGTRARPSHPDWVRSLRDLCAAADVAFLFKQWGHWLPHCSWPTTATPVGPIPTPPRKNWMVLCRDGSTDISDGYFPEEKHGLYAIAPVGAKNAGRLLDGIEHNAFPIPGHKSI